MKFTFNVHENDDGQRLNIFLRSSGVSAALIKKIKFTDDGILVNGIKQNTDYRVRSGETIEINTSDEEMESTVISQTGELDILYEDKCCMVINKPYDMPTHPSFNHPTDTLANYFVGYWEAKGDRKICRIVNRLDRNTSGLVLLALDAHSAEKLKYGVLKKYTAVVEGRLTEEHAVIDAPIARQEESIITRCVREDGQKAVTEYWTIKADDNYSLADIVLHTGRTHQIRVHFSHIGHPLAGDDLYGGKLSDISRHALHCGKITFTSPATNEEITVTAPLPEDMQKLVSKIQNRK